jgi:hypothetical protein
MTTAILPSSRGRMRLPAQGAALQLQATLHPRHPYRYGACGKYRDAWVELTSRAIRPPGPGEVLVQILCASVCGSDIHACQHDAEGYAVSSVPAEGWEQAGASSSAMSLPAGSSPTVPARGATPAAAWWRPIASSPVGAARCAGRAGTTTAPGRI